MIKEKLRFLISLTVLPIALFSVNRYFTNEIGNTTVWWSIQFFIIIIFIVTGFFYFKAINKRHFQFLNWYFVWIIFSLLRGFYMAEIYWDFKALISNMFALFILIIAYSVTDNGILQSIFSFFIKFALPISVVILIALPIGAWGWYFFPISFLMLFLPALNIKWKLFFVFFSLILIFGDLTVRSHFIKYGMPFLLFIIYFLRNVNSIGFFINNIRLIFLITPLLLFVLGFSGIFNVFKIKDYIETSNFSKNDNLNKDNKKQDLMEDSRTFMYEEVLKSSKKYNYWLLGRSPARGNETAAFAKKMEEITGRSERYRNEANIPNVYTWMGLIGVILYFLVFYRASYLAVNKANNIFSKLLGLFISFRWLYAWIEDPTMFGMNEFTIWLMIGVCFSESFRRMNNLEIKLWVQGIFNKKYAKAFRIYEMEKM